MNERHGDGDLDVDAAWAQIVAHWDADDLQVVVDDDQHDDRHHDRHDDRSGPAPAAGTTTDDGSTPDGGGDAGTGDDPARPTASPVRGEDVLPSARGEVRPVGRTPGHGEDDLEDAPLLGWDSIRSHVGGEPVRASSARDDDEDGPLAALDEHFVPDDPPSLRPTDPVSALAWLGALGGPVFLLVAALVWRTAPSVLIGVAVLAFVAGFVTLVVRMPDERDDSDDGAVV